MKVNVTYCYFWRDGNCEHGCEHGPHGMPTERPNTHTWDATVTGWHSDMVTIPGQLPYFCLSAGGNENEVCLRLDLRPCHRLI